MAPALPSVEQEAFSGPIDLLVDEVRRQNVELEEIRMAPLVARFLAYVHGAAERNLNLDIEWLHMAATLILWKSRSLLPQDPRQAEPGRDPVREELIELIRRNRKEAAQQLGEQKRRADAQLSRSPDPLFAPDGEEAEPPFLSVWDLLQQARALARWVSEYRATRAHWRTTFDVRPESVTVAQMSALFRDHLERADSLPFDALPLLVGQPTRAHIACLFLGLLEMARANEITLDQPQDGEEIWVIR